MPPRSMRNSAWMSLTISPDFSTSQKRKLVTSPPHRQLSQASIADDWPTTQRLDVFSAYATASTAWRSFPTPVTKTCFIAWLTAGPNAVISHESALLLYDLSDLLPRRCVLSLCRAPPRAGGFGLCIHTNCLSADDITQQARACP